MDTSNDFFNTIVRYIKFKLFRIKSHDVIKVGIISDKEMIDKKNINTIFYTDPLCRELKKFIN